MSDDAQVKPGHGDHWLAALPQEDPRLREALEPPIDAPAGLALHRSELTRALDRVQVTRDRRLVTAYPEPRATILFEGLPRELVLWETRVEGWLVIEHPLVGALTVFLTDLAQRAPQYAAASRAGLAIEVGALAYFVNPLRKPKGPSRLQPAHAVDPRFLADDYRLEGDVVGVEQTGDEVVYEVELHNGLVLPVTARGVFDVREGDRIEAYAWLTGRLPERQA